jgi:hypothetical protein
VGLNCTLVFARKITWRRNAGTVFTNLMFKTRAVSLLLTGKRTLKVT